MGLGIITVYNNVPYSVIEKDLEEAKKQNYYQELTEINEFYESYRKGMEFVTEGSNAHYIPSQIRYKKASTIINKEARFLFANPPTFNININDVDEESKVKNTVLQNFLDKVFEKNNFNSKLLKAAKDCLIGKRIAIVLNFRESTGISITFMNALQFLYEFSGNGELKKIVTFYDMNDTVSKTEQRWFKKTYTLENDGFVYVEENVYDGLGALVEDERIEPMPKTKLLLQHIPAVVVINGGLTGEKNGVSELEGLLDYEQGYSKLANGDIDAERKSMNPTKYSIDASEESTKGLSSSPGSFWDIQSDESKTNETQARVGILESNMSYSSAVKTTLDRLENTMYSEVDVPNINSEKLQGIITSGKTLKALYWGLIVKCDDMMLESWLSPLLFIANIVIEGGKLYSLSAAQYLSGEVIPEIEYKILIENNYPLPEDVEEEKKIDIAEVGNRLMSIKSYLKKWRRLSDEDADAEIEQIKKEQDLFENSMLPPYGE